MINWNEKPDGAQRYNNKIAHKWLKRDGGIVSYYCIDTWIPYNHHHEGLRHWDDALTDPNRDDELPHKYDHWLYSKCGKRVIVDVYRVLDAFKIQCPIRSHAIKKELCAGTRGHKDELQDLYDIRDSIEEAIKLHIQKGD